MELWDMAEENNKTYDFSEFDFLKFVLDFN